MNTRLPHLHYMVGTRKIAASGGDKENDGIKSRCYEVENISKSDNDVFRSIDYPNSQTSFPMTIFLQHYCRKASVFTHTPAAGVFYE